MSTHFDLIVIGGGPAGHVGAIRAAQLGMNVACIEKEPVLGGTCLRVGCIPSKALLESSQLYHDAKTTLSKHGVAVSGVTLDLSTMMARKDEVVASLGKGIDTLFAKRKITRFLGTGRITGPGAVTVEGPEPASLTADKLLICTGSEPSTLRGITLDYDRIGTSTEALSYPSVPNHLVVIGAGVIGLELGSVWLRLGAKVTVLEYLDRILPGVDSEVAKRAQSLFTRQGMVFKLGAKVTGATRDGDGAVVTVEGHEPLACDRVLVCVGRKPYTANLGLETIGVTLDTRGRIEVDAHLRTKAANVYAVGDVIAGPMLAHKAEEEAVAAVEFMATGYGHVDYDTIPGVVYTHPEIATVGKSEDDLKAGGVPYRKGSFPFAANARAKAVGSTDGFVKILAHKDTDRVLGVHIIGPWASELIAEAATAMAFGASSEDIARACHAHPTLAEAVKEAALAVDGRALRIVSP